MKMIYIIDLFNPDGSLIDQSSQYFKSLQEAINFVRIYCSGVQCQISSFVFNDSINCHHVDGKMFFD